MLGDAETQTTLAGSVLPDADDVLVRTGGDGVQRFWYLEFHMS